jgi:hypothetical protein
MWWVVNATLRPFYPREKPGTLCIGGRSGRVRKILPLAGFDPRTVQPVASRLTGWVLIGSVLCACTLINSIELLSYLLLFKPLLLWEQRHSDLRNHTQHSPSEATSRLARQ